MRLNEFQDNFKSTMLEKTSTPEFLALFAQGDIALPERLQVYRNNIIESLNDAMKATFPVVQKLVGEDFFNAMSRQFVMQTPPAHGCLDSYGAGFENFIADYKPAQSLAYLPDVARFEIALNDAFFAPDDAAISAQDMEDLLEDSVLCLRTSAHLRESAWPLTAIRDFCLEGDQSGTLDLAQGGVKVMVYRPALESMIVTLADDEFSMLWLLGRGDPLGPALESVMEEHPAFDFAHFLQRHLALETFRKIAP